MREKWEKTSTTEAPDGQPIPQKIHFIYEPSYKPKLLLKSPSVRALQNYNNLSIVDSSQNTFENMSFIPENGNVDFNTYDDTYASTITSNASTHSIYPNNYDLYDYTTLGSSSVKTAFSNNGSELGSERNEMGSTTKLVNPKMEMSFRGLDYDNNERFENVRELSFGVMFLDHTNKQYQYHQYDNCQTQFYLQRCEDLNTWNYKLMCVWKRSDCYKRLEKVGSCQTWFTHLETVLYTMSLAAGFGNVYRLPQTALLQGGLPFLVAYVILTLLVGLPLLFLELGIGQLAQEGFIKSWRAVPFFRGIGYVKLIAGCLLGIYYPIYMGLSLYYIIWISKSPVPFKECAVAKMTKTGYSADGQDGQQCLQKTFLESPFEDAQWYGIFAGILFVIWVIVTILSIRKTKSFITSITILLFPVLGCFIALIVKAVSVEHQFQSLERLGSNIDWTVLQKAHIWYYAAIQVFFSTNVGFGTFVTNAGIIYNKVNPFWIAFSFISANLVFGVGSVILCYIFSFELETILPGNNDKEELHLVALMYTILVKSADKDDAKIWAIIAYAGILLAGFTSMVTITYTLLKAITVQNKRRLKWWQTSIVLSFAGLVLGCAVLLQNKFQVVRLLDHYLVGNFILISVIIEVFALIAFYGTERIKSDFEFMLGHILSRMWLVLWWFLPLLLTAIFAWALAAPADAGGIVRSELKDEQWLMDTGWGIVLLAAIFIFLFGFYTVTQQDGYTLADKFKTSLKPSKKWGPKDPMLRHTWIQWSSKTKQGERDFTLKRRGTRDYTRSIKKSAKKANLNPSSNHVSDQIRSIRTSNGSTEYIEPYYVNSENAKTMRVTSLVDSLDPPSPSINVNITNSYHSGFKPSINPLARSHVLDTQSSNSEGYGTFRKGPYIIPDSNVTHVCHRRFSQSEDATEL